MGGVKVWLVLGARPMSGLGGDRPRTDGRTDRRTDGTAKFLGTASHFLNMHTHAQGKQMNDMVLIPNPFATLGV